MSCQNHYALLFRLAGVAAILGLAGCQDTLGVSGLNRCGEAIEVQAGSSEQSRGGWSRLDPNERDQIVAARDEAKVLYVDVRSVQDERLLTFAVIIADLPKPPEGVDDDVEIVLEGDRCPLPAT